MVGAPDARTSPWSWWALWLWLAAPFLLLAAAAVALPLVLEETAADRADALASRGLPAAALLVGAALATAGGWLAARRAHR